MKRFSRRDVLRAKTAASHAMLEAEVGSLDARGAYLRYVRGLYTFRSACEAAVTAFTWPHSWSEWTASRIADELAADMADLRVKCPTAFPQIQLINDIDALIGTLYVLEGSSLGARVLVGSAAKLGFHSAYGARHLERQAAALGTWKSFLQSLETTPSLNMAVVTARAVATFECARESFRLQQSEPETI